MPQDSILNDLYKFVNRFLYEFVMISGSCCLLSFIFLASVFGSWGSVEGTVAGRPQAVGYAAPLQVERSV